MKTASENHPDTWQWIAWKELVELRPQNLDQGIARIAMASAIGRSDFVDYLRWQNVYLSNNEKGR